MRILVDMNLSPQWCESFAQQSIDSDHWSHIGDPCAPDSELFEWARQHDCIVFTNDLDFSALLASTNANGPSVIQVRAQDLLPAHLATLVIGVLRQFEYELSIGAIIVIDERRTRVRLLPLQK